jgi:nucleotide-binding universal stress UspA family protein
MKTILAAVDFSEVTNRIMTSTSELARAFDAKVYIIHIAPPDPTFVTYEPGPQSERDFHAKELRQEHRDLQQLAASLIQQGLKADSLLVQGPSTVTILDEAIRLEADLIIIGSHGHGKLYELLVGSVTEGVIQNAECPVMVIPSER